MKHPNNRNLAKNTPAAQVSLSICNPARFRAEKNSLVAALSSPITAVVTLSLLSSPVASIVALTLLTCCCYCHPVSPLPSLPSPLVTKLTGWRESLNEQERERERHFNVVATTPSHHPVVSLFLLQEVVQSYLNDSFIFYSITHVHGSSIITFADNHQPLAIEEVYQV